MGDALRFFCGTLLLSLFCGGANALEPYDITFHNALGEEIVDVRVGFAAPTGELKVARYRAGVAPGGECRIGLPANIPLAAIRIELATKSYLFEDVSGLDPEKTMRLEFVHEDGSPRIRRSDAEGEAEGIAKNYLTHRNRPNAVKKRDVVGCPDRDAVLVLVRERIRRMLEEKGDIATLSLDAGRIRDPAHAGERCPEIVREWNAAYGREARWTGQWRTAGPGGEGVCVCVTGTADERETLFLENDDWGDTAIFPVVWEKWHGTCHIRDDPDQGMVIAIRLPFSPDNAAEMLRGVLADFRDDGYRPARFIMNSGDPARDGGELDATNREIDFRQERDGEASAYSRLLAVLTEGYARFLVKGVIAFVEIEAFEKNKAGGKEVATRGILCSFSKGMFEAIFMPDGAYMLQ